MINLGIMQGRLTPQKGRGIQFFPFDNWKNEFFDANEISANEIEWLFDYDNYTDNPIWCRENATRINELKEKTGVQIRSVCLHYFIKRPFHKYVGREREAVLAENRNVVFTLLDNMTYIGAKVLEIPILDSASIRTVEEENDCKEFIEEICSEASVRKLEVSIESDYMPEKLASFIHRIGRDNLKVTYDSGNSSGLGYDHQQELRILGTLVGNVHIKDRIRGGGTVPLGTGSADFDCVFRSLKEVGYSSSLILEAARGQEGREKENVCEQLDFVRGNLERFDFK